MKVIPLMKSGKTYSCNSYLILGNWNRIEDINTLIDPGNDPDLLKEIERIPTGFGKIAVEQIILTHNHFDHAGIVMEIKKHFKARVFANSRGPGVDEILRDGQLIRAGDDILEVLHTPGHSSDSICLYAPSEKILFSGDTQIRIRLQGEQYSQDVVNGILKIACRDLHRIYSGHDPPILEGCNELVLQSLRIVQNGYVFQLRMERSL